MADGGFNLRKWLTNDSQVRAKIETDAKVDSAPVSEEDITYAKSSVGMRLGCKGQKVLGLAWDYEADVIGRRPVSSVGRVPDYRAGGRGFKHRPDQHSGSLNN